MGLIYSYDIMIKKDHLKQALQEVYKHCVIQEGAPRFEIVDNELIDVLPNGSKTTVKDFTLPDPPKADMPSFLICLRFEPDEIIKKYILYSFGKDQTESSDDYIVNGKYQVGFIHLFITDISAREKDTIELSFEGVSTSIGEIFRDSPAIRKFFVTLCQDMNAIYALFFDESQKDDKKVNTLIWDSEKPCNNRHTKLQSSFAHLL